MQSLGILGARAHEGQIFALRRPDMYAGFLRLTKQHLLAHLAAKRARRVKGFVIRLRLPGKARRRHAYAKCILADRYDFLRRCRASGCRNSDRWNLE